MSAGLAIIVFGGVLMVIGAFIAEWPSPYTERKQKAAMTCVFMGSAFIALAALSMFFAWALGVS